MVDGASGCSALNWRGGTDNIVRTSAAAAAAAFGSLFVFPSPNVRGGPPTVLLGALALLGTDALVAGAGAEPRVLP